MQIAPIKPPSFSSLQNFYNRYHRKNRDFTKVISRNNFTYFYLLELLHSPLIGEIAGKKVLDVGCGVGTLCLYLAKQGADVTGIDVSSRAIKIAQKAQKALKLGTVRFFNQEISRGKHEFDLIICTEVIEHVIEEERFLKHLKSNLKSGGLLLLTTPSKENWLYRRRFYATFDREVGHLRRYTKAGLKKLLTDHGFKIKYLAAEESPLRNLLFTTPFGFLIKVIKGPLIPLFHWLDRQNVKVWGASDLLVVAEAP
jgi:2-polyprenyl-3-methyl-5-hydroxy-6-metoxy-1,4-benzoquinol methylase